MIDKITAALISTVNILNLELILLGHESVFLSDRHIHLLEENINKYKFTDNEIHVSVKRAFFKEDSQLFGAACNVIYQAFKGNLLFE